MDALIACARELAELPDEAAATEFTPTETGSNLRYALGLLCGVETRAGSRSTWAITRPVRLSGHARVLAVEPYDADRPPAVLATPLYVQYAERG
jgi:hypothetical protein